MCGQDGEAAGLDPAVLHNEPMQCPTAVRRRNVTPSLSKSAGLPRGNNNAGSPNTTEHRSTESEARPAVSLVTVHGFRTDSHRVGGR
jgi:hypothetical protein